uniref:Uncharacterized protein n=1 Tax=Anopheles dirus TaxID=7168 RepID=A0A182NYX3_9DIPT
LSCRKVVFVFFCPSVCRLTRRARCLFTTLIARSSNSGENQFQTRVSVVYTRPLRYLCKGALRTELSR